MATVLTRCGASIGSTRLVKDGCQGQELSRQADASHSKNAASKIIQYDMPIMSSWSGGGMRAGGLVAAISPSTAPGRTTPTRAPRLNGAASATTQAYTASPPKTSA